MVNCIDKGEMIRNLERIDSLCEKGFYDSAYSELTKMNYDDLHGDKEIAYYNLLLTESALNEDIHVKGEDLMIEHSIRFYEKDDDSERLARAYYNKGVYLFGKGDITNSILFLKKAENEHIGMDVSQLRFLIYVNIAYMDILEGANKLGLEYAKKALEDAVLLDNVQFKCFALNNIAMCYYSLGRKDSAEYYINKIYPNIDKIERNGDRAALLSNIGLLYYENKLYNEAEPLFRNAFKLLPVPTTQINLAKTCYMLGKDAEGDTLFNKAWPEASDEEKVEILQFRAAQAEESGDFATSSRLYKDAHAMQDSVRRNMKTEETVMAQSDYERDRYKERVNRSVVAAGTAVLACVALLVATLVIYYQKRINRAKKTITEGNRLIAEYTEKISELERQDASHADKVSDLKQKIRKLRNDQATVLGNGQRLYDDIAAGGTTATWKKKEFDEFIEFYRLNHADAVADAENNYRRLPSSNIFYLLLVDMQRNDADVQRIMCMTAGALRTMKSRINAKKVA